MFRKSISLLFVVASLKVFDATPVVLWHGFGDDHLSSIKELIWTNINASVYIKSIQLGSNPIVDFERGIFEHPNDQIADVCKQIADDEQLKSGFHAVGFSQGAQFL